MIHKKTTILYTNDIQEVEKKTHDHDIKRLCCCCYSFSCGFIWECVYVLFSCYTRKKRVTQEHNLTTKMRRIFNDNKKTRFYWFVVVGFYLFFCCFFMGSLSFVIVCMSLSVCMSFNFF